MRLLDKTAIITGGASGIGEATARRFVAEGAKVLIADRNIAAADDLASELGSQVSAIECDVRKETSAKEVAKRALALWGRIDILVNNAGSELNKTYSETTSDEWDMVLETDLKGPWMMQAHCSCNGGKEVRKCCECIVTKRACRVSTFHCIR